VISLQSPFWLLLLPGVLPLIFWLHRFNLQSGTLPSTTLFLWRTFQQQAHFDGAAGRPDPRWLLRALIATLLVLSLAMPAVRTGRGPAAEVWVDDSLSMFAREHGRPRIQAAMQRLQTYLRETGASRIRLHSLGNPAAGLSLDPGDASAWQARLDEWTAMPRGEPSPPPVASLAPDSSHILVSDGADSALNDWALSAPLQHIIRVGSANPNVALTRLSLRASLNSPDRIDGIARIDNPGDSPQTVRLFLLRRQRLIETQVLDVPASGHTLTAFTIPAGEQDGFHARIESAGDVLPLDDSLQPAPGTLNHALRYAMPAECGPQISSVLESSPALARDRHQPDIIIDCSGRHIDYAEPALKLHPARTIRRTTHSAHWHSAGGTDSPRLPAGIPYSDEAPALASGATPLLSADARMLILKQQGAARVIDSYLDTSDPGFAAQAEYPLLILGMITRLSGRDLDFAPVSAARDVGASRIAPRALTTVAASPAETRPVETSLVPPLVYAALLLLLLDAAIAAGLVRRFGKQRG